MKNIPDRFSLFTIHYSLFLLIVLQSYSPKVLAQEEWELIHGSDDAFSISDAFMVDTAHIWGTENHSIYFSADFGETWIQQFDYDTNAFISLYFVDSLNGWACGGDDIIHTEDGGQTWEYQVFPHDWYLGVYSVFFLNRDTGWVAGSYMTVFATQDGGDTWVMQHEYISTSAFFLYDVHFYDAMHGCAAGGAIMSQTPVVLTTHDGGNTWLDITPPGNESLVKIRFSGASMVWAIDGDDQLIKSCDQGYTWEVPFQLPYYFNPKLMHFFNENEAIIADPMSIELAFTNDAWNTLWYDTLYFYNHFNEFSFDSERNGIASGWGNMLRTRDGGLSWWRINERFVRISFFDQFNGWIIPEYLNNKLLHTTDGGLTWHQAETSHTGMFHQMQFVNDNTGFILTGVPELLKTIDAGASWEIIDLPFEPSYYFSDLLFLDQNNGFISAYPNRLYKTYDGGLTWEYDTLLLNYIWAIDFINPDEGWAVDHSGHLAHTLDGGANWSYTSFPVNNLQDVVFVNSLHGFVLTSNILYQTDDGGTNWQELHFDGSFSRSLNFTDELNGWIVGENEIYRTYDGGFSWNLVLENTSVNPEHEFTGFFALDTGNAWICSMDGRVFSCADFVGIGEEEKPDEIIIYPNPARDFIVIDLNNQNISQVSASIYSYDGKILLMKDFSGIMENKIRLDISFLPSGIYFVRINGQSFSFSEKILKM